MNGPVPAWLPPIEAAADAAYEASPAPGQLDPAVLSRLRRIFAPAPPAKADAA